jgi:neutral trehalase
VRVELNCPCGNAVGAVTQAADGTPVVTLWANAWHNRQLFSQTTYLLRIGGGRSGFAATCLHLGQNRKLPSVDTAEAVWFDEQAVMTKLAQFRAKGSRRHYEGVIVTMSV